MHERGGGDEQVRVEDDHTLTSRSRVRCSRMSAMIRSVRTIVLPPTRDAAPDPQLGLLGHGGALALCTMLDLEGTVDQHQPLAVHAAALGPGKRSDPFQDVLVQTSDGDARHGAVTVPAMRNHIKAERTQSSHPCPATERPTRNARIGYRHRRSEW